jgi:hypothetical protein
MGDHAMHGRKRLAQQLIHAREIPGFHVRGQLLGQIS